MPELRQQSPGRHRLLPEVQEEGQEGRMNEVRIAGIADRVAKNLTAQHLENVKTIGPLTTRETTRAIRDAIIAEEGAINQYETIVDSTQDDRVKEVLQDIANEEKVHVGELQRLLALMLDDEQDFLDEGADEVDDE